MLSNLSCHAFFELIEIIRDILEQLQTMIGVSNYAGKVLWLTSQTPIPDSNSAAPKRTLQIKMDADVNLPAAKRYNADRPDCDN